MRLINIDKLYPTEVVREIDYVLRKCSLKLTEIDILYPTTKNFDPSYTGQAVFNPNPATDAMLTTVPPFPPLCFPM